MGGSPPCGPLQGLCWVPHPHPHPLSPEPPICFTLSFQSGSALICPERHALGRARVSPNPSLTPAGLELPRESGRESGRLPRSACPARPLLCNLNKTPPSPRAALTRRPVLRDCRRRAHRTGSGGLQAAEFGAAPAGCDPRERRARATMRARPQVCEALLFALAFHTGVCYGIKWL